jgi:sporulation protein YlmC with PRC-barrel domain
MRLTRARKRPVVDTSTAATVGRVAGAVIDPSERRITAVTVDGSDAGSIVSWEDVSGFGPDALAIPSTDVLRLPRVEREERTIDGALDVMGKAVYDEAGDHLGKVRDVEFDPESGAVEAIVVDRDDQRLDGSRLLGIGGFAVVVAVSG